MQRPVIDVYIAANRNMKRNSTTALLIATTTSYVWCAPPLNTDDASTLQPGTCQLEIEQRRFGNRVERDVVPACNLWFDTEIGVGHQRVSPAGAGRTDSIVVQAKKVLGVTEQGDWSVGVGAATVRAMNSTEQSGIRQNYVNAILTRQVGATALHANLGVVFDREADVDPRRSRQTWAIAVEHEATSRWTVVAELFGQRGVPQSAQFGLRWWAIPKYVQLTTSLGSQRSMGSDGRWMSVGIRFESPDWAH